MRSKSLRPLVVVGALVLSGLMATYAYAGLKKPGKPVGTGEKGALKYTINPQPCVSSATSCTVSFGWTAAPGNPTTHFVIRREGKIHAVVPKGTKKGETWNFDVTPQQPNSTEVPASTVTHSDTITTVTGTNKKGTKTCSVSSTDCAIYLTYKVRAINRDPTKEEDALSKGAASTEQFKLSTGKLTSVVGG